ncbi:MAG: hypothetical protein ACLU3N_03225 [Lachnospiraceae bacterium]
MDLITCFGRIAAIYTFCDTFQLPTMYNIFVALAIGLILLNWVWQLFKNYGLSAGIEAEDPIKLSIRSALFILLAYFSDEIVDIVLKIGGTPYSWILNSELPALNFADFNSAIITILSVCASGAVTIIALILVLILAWNYVKLLFEAAERYVLLGVLVYTAPVAFATGASQYGNIFGAGLMFADSAFADECLFAVFTQWSATSCPIRCHCKGGSMKKRNKILLMLAVMLVMVCMFSVPAFAMTESEVQAQVDAHGKEAVTGNVFIWFLCAIAFLKVSQKIDSFMSSLGINVGHTGGSMLGEALIAARGIASARNFAGGGGHGGNGGVHLRHIMRGGLAGVVP